MKDPQSSDHPPKKTQLQQGPSFSNSCHECGPVGHVTMNTDEDGEKLSKRLLRSLVHPLKVNSSSLRIWNPGIYINTMNIDI